MHGHEEHAEGIWQSYLELITDPAHILLELTLILIIDVLLVGLAYPFFKAWLKRHDTEKHGHVHCDEVHDDDIGDWDEW